MLAKKIKMADRQYNSQSVHDKVISKTKNFINQNDYDIYENPGGYKNAGINDNYPDIILTLKGTTTVEFIIEVETSDSINLNEAINQWKKYSTEIRATFYLLVPYNFKNIASNLCRRIGISARMGTYQQDAFGNIINIIFD